MNARNREDAVTLEILDAVERQNDVSQRHLADRLGVALGLANLYLKRCTRKGLIKIKQAPANRYLYYLTPKGFAEKGRLTAAYLSFSFDFYRRAGASCADVFRHCVDKGHRRVLLCGASDLAEIASLRADEHGIEIVGTFDPACRGERFIGRPVWRRLTDAGEFDACLLTALIDSAAHYDDVAAKVDPARIMIPDVLRLTPSKGTPGTYVKPPARPARR